MKCIGPHIQSSSKEGREKAPLTLWVWGKGNGAELPQNQ